MEWTDKIDAYIKGDLAEKDRLAFEAAMQANTQLQEQVKVKKTALEAIQLLRMDAKRAILYEESQNIAESKPKLQPVFLRNLLKVAAIFLLLFLGLSWYATRTFNDAQLVQNSDYFLAPFDPSIAGSTPNVNELFTKGINSYFGTKDYPQTIVLMQQIPENHTLYQNAQLFLAASHFRLKDYDNAIEVYQALLKQPLSEKLKTEIAWNQLLAEIGLGKSVENKKQLSQIANDNEHPFQDKAIALQQEQESFWRYFSWNPERDSI